MARRWGPLRTGAASVMLGTWCATCAAGGILAPWGQIGASELQLLYEAVGVMMIVVAPVLLLTLVFAWWFRASNRRATYLPDWAYSGKIEFTIWIIPLLIVLFLAAIAWTGSHELDPYKPLKGPNRRLRVEVVSLDWKWLFIYPEQGVASINELAIPVDTPVSMDITSGTVMNAIFIPGLAGQIYAMTGMCTQMSVLASTPGNFRGLATQFSGDGFSDMHFKVISTDRSGFDRWVDDVRRSGGALDRSGYEKLLGTRSVANVAHFATAEAGLFDYALQRGKKSASAVVDRPVDPAAGACQDMTLTNGVN